MFYPESGNTISNTLCGLPEVNIDKPEEIIAALETSRGFITEIGNGFDLIAEELFKRYNQFIQQPNEYKQQFKGEMTTDTKGYYEDSIVNGNKIGPRFFIRMDKNNQLSQTLPIFSDGTSMKVLNESLHVNVQPIIDKTIKALEDKFKFNRNELKSQFFCASATSLHHNKPVSREKLQHWLDNKQLTKTPDGNIEAMMQHKDLVGLTVLIYRNNNAKGLEIKIKNNQAKGYVALELPQSKDKVKVVVILGRLMNQLIPSMKALSHRVIASPLAPNVTFSRDVINIFVLPDMQATLVKGKQKMTAGEFFSEVFKLYEQRREEKAAVSISTKELESYPKAEDIEVINTSQGISYKLK